MIIIHDKIMHLDKENTFILINSSFNNIEYAINIDGLYYKNRIYVSKALYQLLKQLSLQNIIKVLNRCRRRLL